MLQHRSVRSYAILAALAAAAAAAFAQAPASGKPAAPADSKGIAAAAPATDAEAIGSVKNSRAAHPVRAAAPGAGAGGGTAPLVYLAGEVSDDAMAGLALAAPGVRIIRGLTRETALAHAAEAHGADAHLVTPELLERAPLLVWVQSRSAGVERYVGIRPLAENDRIVLTNMRAAHGPAIADHAFAMLLTLTRNLREFERAQDAGQWLGDSTGARPIALQGRTMLVVGLGGIGSEVAQRAHGFGMRVIGTRRTDAPGPAWIERVGRPGDLLAMLPEADVVAVCVPLTDETEGLFDEGAFAAMKKGAYLVNVARGRVVRTDALLAALRSGRLAGGCLDVTDPEPLPAGHALWREPNVIITPHVSADAELTDERSFALLRENMRRFDADEPLLNVVDKKAGY